MPDTSCDHPVLSDYDRGRLDAAMRCAEIADAMSSAWWDKYKRGNGPERANPHYQGMSDGAGEVAEAIRREFGIEE